MLKIGQKAPHFEAQDQHGLNVSLNDFQDKWIVLYFYPKDETPGCIKEACGFRDVYTQLKKKAVVIGVSADSVSRHRQFAQNHHLPFILLADVDKYIITAYEAWGKKQFMGKEYHGILRISYLINPAGRIAKVYRQVNPSIHPQEVVSDIQEYQD